MSCQRAEEIDLTAFLADRRGDEWAAFRDHYPRCAECARAVAQLSALESALRASGGEADSGGGGASHIDEDDLLAYAEGTADGTADGTLAPARRAALETHLEGCPACRSELAVLQRFDPAEALAPLASHAEAGDPIAAPHAASAEVVPVPLGSRLRGWLEEWLAPVPAFALAAAAVVALGVVWAVAFRDPGEPAPRLVERERPRSERGPEAPAPETALPGPEAGSGDAGTQLAEERPGPAPGDESEGAAGPSAAPDAPSPRPEQLAAGPEEAGASGDDRRGEAFEEDEPSERLAERDASPDPGERGSDTPPSAEPSAEPKGEREVVLLAALLPSELPRYALPPDLEGAGLGLVRSGAGLRGGEDVAPRVSVLAPEHVGLTTSAAPTLHWVLDRESPHPVELIVTDPDADEPLLEKRLAPPVAAGAHALDLAAEGVSLAPGTAYVWSVAVVVDEDAREADVVSMGAVRFEPGAAGAAAEDAAAGMARRVHRLAEAGAWYDAWSELSRWIAAQPELERLRDYRRALLRQTGLESAIPWLERAGSEGARDADAAS